LLVKKIEQLLPEGIQVVSQAALVGSSLQDYLQRHPEIEGAISRSASRTFFTTDSTVEFDSKASMFFGAEVKSIHTGL
jgi:glutamate racemase